MTKRSKINWILGLGLLVCAFGGKNVGENIQTQLLWHICDSDIESVHKKLALPLIKKFDHSTYYFDTKDKDLYKNKYAIRLRKENNKWLSTLKMDLNEPRDIPDFIPPTMKCEKNYYKDEQFLNCTAQYKKATLEKPLSETQEDYLEEKFQKDIKAIPLVSFGPFEGQVLKLKYQAQDKKNLILVLDEVQGKFKTFEISAQVGRVKDEVYFQELNALFLSKKINLCTEQKGRRPPILDL